MTALRAPNLFILHSCLVLAFAGCSGDPTGASPASGGAPSGTSTSGGAMQTGGTSPTTGGTSPTTGGTGGSTGGTNPTTGGMAGGGPTGGSGGATGGSGGSTGGTGATGGDMPGGAPNGGGGGMPPSGGSGGDVEGGMGGGPPQQGTCTIEAKARLSEKVATVGIVEWSTDLQGLTGARIEFGLDTSYGLTAPVDLDEPNYKTLLLGMKPSKTYNFRIVARAGETECASDNYTIETGPRATGLPQIEITTQQPDKLSRGFIITAQYQGTNQGGLAYILDQDGDFVWWYFVQGGTQFTRAVMSRDGKYMWAAKANVPVMSAEVYRIAMDGSSVEDLSTAFANQNHDLAVLPDDSVAFIAYGQNGCDDIKLWKPDGTVSTIINSKQIANNAAMCHCNALEYSPSDQTIVFSELNSDRYAKVKLNGEVVWVLGKGGDFSGEGASWDNQHGLHVLGEDRLLIFNNGPGPQTKSRAIEILLDLSGKTATRVWDYQGTAYNQIMGDVQRLPNGNTLVTYSNVGLMEEVDPDKNLVQQIEFALGGAFGYADKVPSLYPQSSSTQ